MSDNYEAAMMLIGLNRLEEAMEHRELDLFRDILKRHEIVPQCVHTCQTGQHLMFSHDEDDKSACDQFERLIANGAAHCEECQGQ